MFDGKNYCKVIDGKLTKVADPENIEEYNYYRNQVLAESPMASTYAGWQLGYVIKDYAQKFDQMMKERFPGKELTQAEFGICYDPKAPRDSLSEVAFMVYLLISRLLGRFLFLNCFAGQQPVQAHGAERLVLLSLQLR